MKFEDLERRMRVYEGAFDASVLPGMHIVCRLDGRSFTRLTKETMPWERPFDERMRDLMVGTTQHLMGCGFSVTYGYTQSDEISLLFALDETTFARKVRKLISTLAGEASAAFSLAVGRQATFDARVIPLPNADLVVDYFRWRQADAHRNALNSHCYWTLRAEGMSEGDASAVLLGKPVSVKNELLFSRGINFDDLPAWQKRGVGVYTVTVPKVGVNPLTGESAVAERRRLHTDMQLPIGDAYAEFLRRFLDGAGLILQCGLDFERDDPGECRRP